MACACCLPSAELRARTQRRDLLEHPLLMPAIGLDRLDQLRHQIVAPLQLHVDIGKTVTHQIPGAHQAIEHHNAPHQQDGDEENQDGLDHPVKCSR
ncbi:MAG: hypothetical protein U5L08_08530 [Xanthomonadales bacterium]|nr:hypothetical protein [Xanthomonadales bacterium]